MGTQVGAYRLVRQIGAGGMGAVWLAEHEMLGRRAAVKLLHKEYTGRSEIVSRFFNEARAATAISDPGIVQIFDFGHHTDGTAYIVMELLEGEGLDKRLREHGPMQPVDALRIIRQVASSLGAAHARGIVHRDLKPENIYLVHDSEVAGGERAKILDFGIAKLQGDTVGWRTQTSQVMGTPLYMSPEQCRGAGAVDQRSDIYSLGCMLFVLVTGRPPFLGEGSGDLIAMHLREPPPLASSFSVRVTPELDQLISRCLTKDPAQRPSNGAELANAITLLLSNFTTAPQTPTLVTSQQPPVPISATTLSSSTGAMFVPPQTSPPRPARRRGDRKMTIAGGAAVVVIGGIVAFALMRDDDNKSETASARSPADAAQVTVTTPHDPTPDAAVMTAPPADPRGEMTKPMLQAAGAFLRWSAAHKGAACPTPKALGAPKDAWDHAMKVTCTEQPPNQMIGIISPGPDGTFGNADDVASWTLADVTSLIAGARWVAAKRGGTRPGGTTTTSGVKNDIDGDGIPDDRSAQ